MTILWTLCGYAILAALLFVVVGIFVGISIKTLRWVLLLSLLLALIRFLYVASQGSMTVVWLSLLLALVISARLMFFRAP
jgi:hypothetical protein